MRLSYGGDCPDGFIGAPSGEQDVLTLIAARLLSATAQAHRFEAVTAVLDCQVIPLQQRENRIAGRMEGSRMSLPHGIKRIQAGG